MRLIRLADTCLRRSCHACCLSQFPFMVVTREQRSSARDWVCASLPSPPRSSPIFAHAVSKWARAAVRSAWLSCSWRRADRRSAAEVRDGKVSMAALRRIGSIAVGMGRAVKRIGGAVARCLSHRWLTRDCRSVAGHQACCAAHAHAGGSRDCNGRSSCQDVRRVIAGE